MINIKRCILSTLIAVFSFSVKADNTVNTGEVFGPSGIAQGNFDNYGDTRLDAAYVLGGWFNNYGNVISSDAFSITGEEGIINHPAGNMVVMGYMDIYQPNAVFENAGRFSAIDSWYTTYPQPFTYAFKGTIKNTGSFLIDKSRPVNACKQAQNWPGPKLIENTGKFEIAQGTNCDFSKTSSPDNDVINTHFIQNAGELKVDGYFATQDTRINAGAVSGAGTIEGLYFRLLNKVTLSPGSPIGTLAITSNRPYLFCGRCSVDIELSGPADSDRLQVNSRFFIRGLRLNVLLRDGYVPQQGDSFDIISADNGIVIFGTPLSYGNLPELPSGLSWDVHNDGTTITLSVI